MNEPLSFARAVADFRDGTRTPRAFLEQCLKTIAARDRTIKAFVTLERRGGAQSRRCLDPALQSRPAPFPD